jgi:UDP-N-acetylglucosamine diphosphorylase / glucose-1-phosphate thymidylyltransferase / UDP-N-acetylgalactosamine diphosphorylase / glucosamine-1-phosphate N-acetyltransferase / galactosamine-1-phosphate N-acetyltransferase
MQASPVHLAEFISAFMQSPLGPFSVAQPWELTTRSEAIVRDMLAALPRNEFNITNEVAVHVSATVETGAILKGPLILGPHCFVASGAYLRGGNWVGANCTFGPGAELKSSFVFSGSKLAHFNFVGDSILGSDVNLEAGSIICNYRNERSNKEVLVRSGSTLHPTGCQKFGALVGDHGRIGTNAVVAPGAILAPHAIVRRGALRDDETLAEQHGTAAASPT